MTKEKSGNETSQDKTPSEVSIKYLLRHVVLLPLLLRWTNEEMWSGDVLCNDNEHIYQLHSHMQTSFMFIASNAFDTYLRVHVSWQYFTIFAHRRIRALTSKWFFLLLLLFWKWYNSFSFVVHCFNSLIIFLDTSMVVNLITSDYVSTHCTLFRSIHSRPL